MLVTKNDRSKARPSSDTSPNATTMATIASTTGTTAAARVPNTTIRMARAATMPMVSPWRRSCSAMVLESLAAVASPATQTLKPWGCWACSVRSSTWSILSLASATGPVGILGRLDDPRLERVQVTREPRHVRLEPGIGDGLGVRPDDHHLVGAAGPGQPLLEQRLGLLGVGVVGEVSLRGQGAAQIAGGEPPPNHEQHDPQPDHSEAVLGAPARHALRREPHVLPLSLHVSGFPSPTGRISTF